MEGVSPAIAALQEALLSLPNLLPVTTEGRGQGEKRRKVEAEEEGGKEKLRFLVRTDVPPEGMVNDVVANYCGCISTRM